MQPETVTPTNKSNHNYIKKPGTQLLAWEHSWSFPFFFLFSSLPFLLTSLPLELLLTRISRKYYEDEQHAISLSKPTDLSKGLQ